MRLCVLLLSVVLGAGVLIPAQARNHDPAKYRLVYGSQHHKVKKFKYKKYKFKKYKAGKFKPVKVKPVWHGARRPKPKARQHHK